LPASERGGRGRARGHRAHGAIRANARRARALARVRPLAWRLLSRSARWRTTTAAF